MLNRSKCDLKPDQQFQEVASILARGAICHSRLERRIKTGHSEKSPKSSPPGLEVLRETRLSGSRFQG